MDRSKSVARAEVRRREDAPEEQVDLLGPRILAEAKRKVVGTGACREQVEGHAPFDGPRPEQLETRAERPNAAIAQIHPIALDDRLGPETASRIRSALEHEVALVHVANGHLFREPIAHARLLEGPKEVLVAPEARAVLEVDDDEAASSIGKACAMHSMALRDMRQERVRRLNRDAGRNRGEGRSGEAAVRILLKGVALEIEAERGSSGDEMGDAKRNDERGRRPGSLRVEATDDPREPLDGSGAEKGKRRGEVVRIEPRGRGKLAHQVDAESGQGEPEPT